MSTLTGEGASTGEQPFLGRSVAERRWDVVRWLLLLLLAWLAAAVVSVAIGERASSWDQLRRQVAAGEVDTVRVVGGLSPGASGHSLVELHWRQGGIGRVAAVVQVGGRSSPGGLVPSAGTPVVHQPPSSLLLATQPGLQVEQGRHRGSATEVLGWQLPGWLGVLGFGLSLASLVVLVRGPEPWRATRWAWFWLWVMPLGAVAFLLAGGPVPGVRGPRSGGRRLTGGWAFVLLVVLAGAANASEI